MTKEELLERAIRNGEIVTIRYAGGTQPGSVREIVPRKIDNGHLWAFCVASDSIKNFMLEKIEILTLRESSELTFDPEKAAEIKAKAKKSA